MAPKSKEREKPRKTLVTLSSTVRDPSLPSTIPPIPKGPPLVPVIEVDDQPLRRRLCRYIYNKNNKTICERSCKSWCTILGYAVIYMIFLCTYMLIILFATLIAMKNLRDYHQDNYQYLTYPQNGIELSVTPLKESTHPLIWYRKNNVSDYRKYVNAIDELMLKKRRKRQIDITDLGPCSKPPYGYGDKPCILIRINKQRMWKGVPLQRNSSKAREAPIEVQRWLTSDKKLWLLCSGYHSYDKEHIGKIQYYPDPPGFDPNVFPLDMQSSSPIVAVQISEFTLGVSLTIQCKLWYENAPSTVEFMLYVTPGGNGSDISNIRR